MTWDLVFKISAIATIFSLVTIVPLAITVYSTTVGRRRREQIKQKRSIADAGKHPGIVILELTEREVESTVLQFAAETDTLKQAVEEKRYYTVRADSSGRRTIVPSDMPLLERKYLENTAKAVREGCDVLHVFCGAPMPAAVLFGATLRNFGRVELYHRNKDGQWDNWGPLTYQE